MTLPSVPVAGHERRTGAVSGPSPAPAVAAPGSLVPPHLGDEIAPVWRAVGRALLAVEVGWEHYARGAEKKEVVEFAHRLLAQLRRAIDGEIVKTVRVPAAVMGRRVLEALRRGTLEQMRLTRDAVDGVAVVRVMRGFEQLQSALDRDTASRFTHRLSGPDAVELVVQVAHDMRSPLTSILFLVDALRSGRSGALAPLAQRQLAIVHAAAFGLASLTNDVVELARGGDRLLRSPATVFSMAELFQGVRDVVQPIAEERGLELRFVPSDGDLRVGQSTALGRVLLNLVTNALKYTNAGFVELRAESLGRTAMRFTVSDSGPGIPPELRDSLFDAFRARDPHGSQVVFSSAGLGLSICWTVVAAMGGELKVECPGEGGTRFTFEIPLEAAERTL